MIAFILKYYKAIINPEIKTFAWLYKKMTNQYLSLSLTDIYIYMLLIVISITTK